MKPAKQDKRVQATKQALKQSLLELMKTQSIDKITVTDICEEAHINRNTFYTHYNRPADVLTEIESIFLETIHQSLHTESVSEILVGIFRFMKEHNELCTILFGEHGDADFLKRVMYIIHDYCITAWRRLSADVDVEQLELVYIFAISGSTGIIQHWIKSGYCSSPEAVARFIERMSNYGLHALLPNI